MASNAAVRTPEPLHPLVDIPYDREAQAALWDTPLVDLHDKWDEILGEFGAAGERWLCRYDRFYLLVYGLKRPDVVNEWLYARCREVERAPDGYLDLWAREHYKSTIITFAGSIQEVLKDPEITIGIFSHTKGVSKKFLLQIKGELERNAGLKTLFSDILWWDPKKDAGRAGAKWNEDRLDVKRKSNPKEGTIEAHGLVDGQPTGSHFILRIYDDVVTRESVATPEQVQKTTLAWELSDNLGARPGDSDEEEYSGWKDAGRSRCWHIGTRYHFADTYHHILEKKILKPRIYPATDNGRMDGKPVFLSPEVLAQKILVQGSNFPAQMLQNPAAGQNAMFQKEWLRFTDIRPGTLNVYIMGDPASSKKKGSDNTAIPVIGVDAARNKYLLDGFCHKMNLRERWLALRELRRKWQRQPGVQQVYVGYEKYGMQSDLDYFEEQMERDGDAFEITELNWTKDGTESKHDRVGRLVPDFIAGKFYLAAETTNGETSNQKRMRESGQAYRILEVPKRKDHEGNLYSLNKIFLNEFLFFPFAVHDDLIDATSRLYDMDYLPPVIIDESATYPEVE